ncbi:hypothetical protein GF377_01160 [candidate division GN15 bacterium]|nr:hypothetical protein [candidate division GN15 bacterium]
MRHEDLMYRLRVLLLQASRYRGLLIEREITRRYTSAVISRFELPQQALAEFSTTSYDIVLVDLETSKEATEEILFGLRERNPQTVLIVFGPSDAPTEQHEAADNWADTFVETNDELHTRLPAIIERFSNRWQDTPADPDEGGILDARTRTAVVGTTVRTLAHEVNNPLMTILGTTELLLDKDDSLTPQQREKVTMIRESASRIRATLSELANLSGEALRGSPVGPLLQSKPDSFE